MQAFVAGPIGQPILVSVEYNAERRVSAVRIAPPGYPFHDRNEHPPGRSMDHAAVSPLLDFFVPPQRQRELLDISISRSSVAERDLFVEIHSHAGLLLAAPDIESRFGAARIERFIAQPDTAVTATYDETRTATEIVIAPARPLLEDDNPPRFLRKSDAERITGEIAPAWARNGLPLLINMHSGCNELRVEEFDNLTIATSFHHCSEPQPDSPTQVVIRWGPRRLPVHE